MSLKIKIEISSTDDPRYKEIVFGTYETEFDINEMAKIAPRPTIWRRLINRRAGVTTDNRLAFLEHIEIIPRIHFGRPIDIEDPLGLRNGKK